MMSPNQKKTEKVCITNQHLLKQEWAFGFLNLLELVSSGRHEGRVAAIRNDSNIQWSHLTHLQGFSKAKPTASNPPCATPPIPGKLASSVSPKVMLYITPVTLCWCCLQLSSFCTPHISLFLSSSHPLKALFCPPTSRLSTLPPAISPTLGSYYHYLLWAELCTTPCATKFICWSSNPKYLKMWTTLEKQGSCKCR